MPPAHRLFPLAVSLIILAMSSAHAGGTGLATPAPAFLPASVASTLASPSSARSLVKLDDGQARPDVTDSAASRELDANAGVLGRKGSLERSLEEGWSVSGSRDPRGALVMTLRRRF